MHEFSLRHILIQHKSVLVILGLRRYSESCHTINALYFGVLKGNKLQKGCTLDVRRKWEVDCHKKEKEIQCGVPQ